MARRCGPLFQKLLDLKVQGHLPIVALEWQKYLHAAPMKLEAVGVSVMAAGRSVI
jgi:hypothetical protein